MATRYASSFAFIWWCMCCTTLHAQVPWSSHYSTMGDSLTATDPVQLVHAANGDLVVVCRMADLPLHEHVRFLRLAADGTLISAREHVFSTGAFIYTAAELPDGRFVATGSERITNRAVMLVFGPMGELLSCKSMQHGSQGNITAVIAEADTTLTASFRISAGWQQALTTKFHPDSAQVLATHLVIDGEPGGLSANTRCTDGGTYHSGAIYPSGTSEINLALARTDMDGNVLWAEHLMAGGLTYVQGMAELPDGGALVGGTFAPTPGDGHPFILRTDMNGAPLWMKYLVDTTGVSTGWGVRTTQLLSPDTFLLVGRNNIHGAFRIAVDTTGTLLFADIWPDAFYFSDVERAPNGDVLLAMSNEPITGPGTSPGVLRMQADLLMDCPPTPVGLTAVPLSPTVANSWSANTLTIPWLDITASITQTTPITGRYDACIQTGAAETVAEASALQVYPNPTAHRLTLSIASASPGRLSIMDARGHLVLERSMQQHVELDVSGWAAGVYLARVQLGDRVVQQRVVVQ